MDLAEFVAKTGELNQIIGRLGRDFQDLHHSRRDRTQLDSNVLKGEALWHRFKPTYQSLLARLRELKPAVEHPPAGGAEIAAGLRQAAGVAKKIHDVTQSWDDLGWEHFLDLFPDLNSLATTLGSAVSNARSKSAKAETEDVFAMAEPRPADILVPTAEAAVEPPSAKDKESDNEMFSMEELARLAHVTKERLQSVMSQSRSEDPQDKRPPEASVPSVGRRPSLYRYSVVRPWLITKWPEAYFPEFFADALTTLSRLK